MKLMKAGLWSCREQTASGSQGDDESPAGNVRTETHNAVERFKIGGHGEHTQQQGTERIGATSTGRKSISSLTLVEKRRTRAKGDRAMSRHSQGTDGRRHEDTERGPEVLTGVLKKKIETDTSVAAGDVERGAKGKSSNQLFSSHLDRDVHRQHCHCRNE